MASVALVFNGPINAPATMKLRSAICGAANGANTNGQPCERIFLLMSSGGGNLDDGFSLYSLLRSIPCEVTTVNMGQIASIANVIFLAGSRRIACPESYFHFHNFDWGFAAAHTMTPDNLDETQQLLGTAKSNKKAIYKARTNLTDADFVTLNFLERPFVQNAEFALAKGIVHDITMPVLPTGTLIFNIEY